MAAIAIIARSFCRSPDLVAYAQDKLKGHQLYFYQGDTLASGGALLQAIDGCEAALIGREVIDVTLLEQTPNLKHISLYGVGHDNINLAELRARGVSFYSKPGVNADYAAELTIGLIIGLLRNILPQSHLIKQGHWQKDGGVSVKGRRIGILGAGHVGSRVARILAALGAQVSICDLLDKEELCSELGCQQLSLEELLVHNEVLTLHMPLTEVTHHMFHEGNIAALTGKYLINTARSEIIEERALTEALKNRLIIAAALDVWPNEPHINPELTALPNIWGTPHIGGNSKEAVLAMGQAAVDGISAYYN